VRRFAHASRSPSPSPYIAGRWGIWLAPSVLDGCPHLRVSGSCNTTGYDQHTRFAREGTIFERHRHAPFPSRCGLPRSPSTAPGSTSSESMLLARLCSVNLSPPALPPRYLALFAPPLSRRSLPPLTHFSAASCRGGMLDNLASLSFRPAGVRIPPRAYVSALPISHFWT